MKAELFRSENQLMQNVRAKISEYNQVSRAQSKCLTMAVFSAISVRCVRKTVTCDKMSLLLYKDITIN